MTASLTAPVLLSPSSTVALTTDISTLTLIVQTATSAVFVQATITGGTSSTKQSTTVLFTGDYVTNSSTKYFSLPITLGAGVNTVTLQYYTVFPTATSSELAAASSPTTAFSITLDTSSSVPLEPSAPTGFSISQRSTDVLVSWGTPTEDSFMGCNFYMSTTSGGPYFKVNTSPITAQDSTSTTARTFIDIPLSAIPTAYLGTTYSSSYTFYGVVTSMILTTTGSLLESPNSIEIDLNFYTFPSEYTSPINRSESDIQNSLITSINSYESTLDLKPGSVIQDVFVNPVSTELARAYQRLHFYHYAGSVATLVKYEDENGDGVPDTLAQSPLRQELYQAFNLSSSSEVQNWIDMAFERLASLQFDGRMAAKTASGVVTFYTTVTPTTTITIPTGTTVSSNTTTLSGLNPPNFTTVETGSIPLQGLDSYYNSTLARWEVKVHVVSSTTGSAGNVGSGVINTVSGINNITVTNEGNLYGGQDSETNLDLAARLLQCYLAKDPGRKAGIASWVSGAAGIYSCRVVGAGDTYMMRDYDELRQRHVYGRADAYVDSASISEQTQTIVMTPTTLVTETNSTTTVATVTSVSSTDWAITISNTTLGGSTTIVSDEGTTTVSTITPIYQVSYVINTTQSNISYDTTNWYTDTATNGSVVLHLDPTQNTSVSSPALTDTISLEVTIFYSPGYLLSVQPVLSLNSITGESTSDGGAGDIDITTVNLFESQDPMGIGNSVNDTAYLVITPSVQTQTEPITFATPDPLNPTATIDMTYTATIKGAVPLGIYTPTIVNNFDTSATIEAGVDYNLSINSSQQLVVTRTSSLDPTAGSFVLTYETYTAFPRKFTVVGEPIVLNGTTPSYLTNIGVDVTDSTFQITSDLAGTNVLLRYNPGVVPSPNYRVTPYDDSVQVSGSTSPYDQDYWAASTDALTGVYEASQSNIEKAVGIINMNMSAVPDGSTVYVTYSYYENLTVLYSVDQGVIDAQALVETNRSCTANILVKHCIDIPVTAQMSVTLTSGANETTVDTNIRTAVFGLFNALNVGDGIVEADIVKATMNVSGVANLTLPMDQLSFADGATITQENMPLWAATTSLNTATLIPTVTYYQSQTRSLYSSMTNGGYDWEYVAVYEDGLAMARCLSVDEFLASSVGDYGTFYVSPNSVDYRLDVYIKPNRTSTENTDINSHTHTITYHIYGDSTTHDLVGCDLSILTLKSLLINYSD